MKPIQLDPEHLAPDESPPAHPCADISHYSSDLALLNYLLQDLRVLVRQAAAGETELGEYQTILWDVHGLRRRVVICDPVRILREGDVQVVGFLGDRRSTREAERVDAAELDVIGEFRQYPGILSYSSVELVNNQWANLVVHTDPDDREAWRHSDTHIEAAEELAPIVYNSVRIHNGCIRGGPLGPENVVIETTKYFDYGVSPMWHAVRLLPGGATETIGSPWSDLA